MKLNFTKGLLVSLCLAASFVSKSQSPALNTILTADSVTSGNTKDIFSNFYQFAVNNLTGPNKELKFTTNPYAIMLKANPDLQVDHDYQKYKYWRRLNFSVDLKLDSSYHFSGFSSGITFAIINRRDYTVSQNFISALKGGDNNDVMYSRLLHVLTAAYIKQKKAADPNLADALDQLHQLFTNPKFTFDQLSQNVRDWIRTIDDPAVTFLETQVTATPKLNVYNAQHAYHDQVVQSYANRHLLTATISDTTYKTNFAFKNVEFALESTKGFGPKFATCNIEWDVKAAYIFADDTLSAGTNLKRQYLDVEPGLNIVLKNSRSQQSFLEFKASGEYRHIYEGQLASTENHDYFTLNGTLNLRLFNDIWVPLQFKWDPKTGNVFGFLNVTANFTGLASLVKGQAQTAKN